MLQNFFQIIMQFTPKIVYTGIILTLAGVLLKEAYLVWFDNRVFIGNFNISSDVPNQEVDPVEFSKSIVNSRAILHEQLIDYLNPRENYSITDPTFVTNNKGGFLNSNDTLTDLDITFQELNITQIFTTLRKMFSQPNEVTGNVTISENSVLTRVDWPDAPNLGENERSSFASFYIPARSTTLESAKHVACSIYFARGAAQAGEKKNHDVGDPTERVNTDNEDQGSDLKDNEFLSMGRKQFCDFMMALSELYGRKDTLGSVATTNDTAIIRHYLKRLENYYGAKYTFPEIYRLRADLFEMLPKKSTDDLVEAQEDRLRYAMLDPALSKLSEEDKRFKALALARPAIEWVDGKPSSPPENWKNLLDANKRHIERAASATGVLSLSITGHDRQVATAFMVAPNLAVTAGHVLSDIKFDAAQPQNVPDGVKIELCFNLNAGECADRLEITKIHYRADFNSGRDIALLEVQGHSPVLNPHLLVREKDELSTKLVGRYAFVAGFPKNDPRLPKIFADNLLGGRVGIRHVFPGRILLAEKQKNQYVTDISTTVGTSGGPLVDLISGSVVGVSVSGEWRGELGKFSNSQIFPDEVRNMIEKRIAGHDDLQSPKGE